jgi:TolA-binding protein
MEGISFEFLILVVTLATLLGFFITLTNKVDKLGDKITNLKIETKTDISNLKTDISNLEVKMTNEISNLTIRIGRLESKFDRLEDKYSNLDKQMMDNHNSTKEQLTATNQRIDKIEIVSQDVLYKLANMSVATNGNENVAKEIEEVAV